ncbi:MAG: F0F1 ATP synthase subunit delta [Propionibacteriaceae bacterium]|nr:F0F1 ATP synthase subunit delta [Propionibacteriaceae bacterium]
MTDQKVTPGSTPDQVTRDLNQVLRALQAYPALARALIDPSAQAESKSTLIASVFAGISDETKTILAKALTTSWDSTKAFMAWVEATEVEAAWTWAKNEGALDACLDEVFSFGQLMVTNHEVRAAVTDRRVDVEQRQALVRTLLSSTMSEPAIDVALAAVSSRQGTIDDAVQSFLQIGADLADALLAVVTVARPLPSQQKADLGAALQARLGRRIIVEEIVDPDVLGGVRVECGAEVIDSTMTARLEAARRDFA